MTSLIGLMLDAPLVGVLQRWPKRLHAIPMDGISPHRMSFESACGLSGLRLFPADYVGERVAAPWPPRVKGMPEGFVRCRVCFEATGRPRPRCDWRAA